MNNAWNNEALKDGVVPSDVVDSGINNDKQDENLGQGPSTCPSASASRLASVSFATQMNGDSRLTDGVIPSDMVDYWINNDIQDENLGQGPSTCPSSSASRLECVSFI
nr:hypothetical protein [Tanacetum cinerariifolium]GEW60388.1 hypothetical protein [Tanacetum cinerariifolium]